MATIPYMPLYIADYMADTPHFTTLEHGAYMLLIIAYWQRRGPLKNNERLANVARMSNEEWKNVKPVIAEFFEEDGEFWVHKRIEAELAKVKDKSDKAKAAGQASAKRRLNGRSTDVQRTPNGRSTKQKQITETETEKRNTTAGAKRAANGYTPDFEQAWGQFPKRQGDNPKPRAFKAWNARLREGHRADEMADGVRRYAGFVRDAGKEGTEFVKQAATFFGPDKGFLDEWEGGVKAVNDRSALREWLG